MAREPWWEEGVADVVVPPDDQLIAAEEHPDFDEPAGDHSGERGLRGMSPWGEPCPAAEIVTVSVGGGVRFSVHRAIAPLVKSLAEATVARGYRLNQEQCGGYNCRKIRGSNSWSNHAWGLAVDLNWTTNPMISVKELERRHGAAFADSTWTDMPGWLPAMWARYGFRWGGSYRSVRDAMHFEFMSGPGDVAAMIAKLRDDGFDAPEPPPPLLRPGATGPAVTRLHELLTAAGHPTSGPAEFGPTTEAAVRAFQEAEGLDVDAAVGPATWAALMTPRGSQPDGPQPAPQEPTAQSGPAGGQAAPSRPGSPVERRPARPNLAAYPRLARPAESADVHHLQTVLTQLGYDTGGVEGAFGPMTEAAVRAFQDATGLDVDGRVGPATWSALLASLEPRLQRGDSGDDVRRLQELLVAVDHHTSKVDMQFGPGTEAAVKAFQQAEGLDVDGIVGRQTWRALFSA